MAPFLPATKTWCFLPAGRCSPLTAKARRNAASGGGIGPLGREAGKLHAFSLRDPGSEEEQFGFAIYNPDRLAVVSATRLRGLRFWSAQTGRPLTEALLTEGEFANACFEKDQRLLATASRNKTARLWNSQLSACRTWPFIAAALSPV